MELEVNWLRQVFRQDSDFFVPAQPGVLAVQRAIYPMIWRLWTEWTFAPIVGSLGCQRTISPIVGVCMGAQDNHTPNKNCRNFIHCHQDRLPEASLLALLRSCSARSLPIIILIRFPRRFNSMMLLLSGWPAISLTRRSTSPRWPL